MPSSDLTHLAFAIQQNKGVYALMLGSGVSRSSGIRTGWEITLNLLEQKYGSDVPDPESRYKNETGLPPEYSKLVKEFANTRAETQDLLQRYIEPTDEEAEKDLKSPTKAHRAIAEMIKHGFFKVVITTNFDRLLESALNDIGCAFTSVKSAADLAGCKPLTQEHGCHLFKVHGDYKDINIRNSEEELSKFPLAYKKHLKQIFDEYGLVVCGWSGDWDLALRNSIKAAPGRRYSTFWHSLDTPSEMASELIKHRDASVITEGPADEFFEGLRDAVFAIEAKRKSPPTHIEALLALTERYIEDETSEIKLDRLIEDEFDAMLTQFHSEKPANPTFEQLVTSYENDVERFCKFLFLIGRWRGDKFASIVTALLETLLTDRRLLPANHHLSEAKCHAVSLIFYSFTLGLVKAENWHQAHAIFSHRYFHTDMHEDRCFVDRMFLGSWNQTYFWDIWKDLDPGKARRFQLASRTRCTLVDWFSDTLGKTKSPELTIAVWECLGAAVLSEYKAIDSIPDGKLYYVQIANFMFYEKEEVFRILKDEKRFEALKSAGFFTSENLEIELFKQRVEETHKITRRGC